jgi:hypothetical protein
LSGDIWGDVLLLAGFGSGLYWFFDGFRYFREYKILANTPQSRTRGLAMGLVEVRGRARGEVGMISPVTHTRCLLYKVDIERWEDERGRGRWSHYWTDIRAAGFHIEDESGRVLVDPQDAEYDLKPRAVREIGSSGRLSWLFQAGKSRTNTGNQATDGELTDYIAHLGFDPALIGDPSTAEFIKRIGAGGTGSSLQLSGSPVLERVIQLAGPAARTGRFRLTEHYIAPGEPYDVTGTCVENPDCNDENDRNVISKGEKESIFLISWRDPLGVERAVMKKAALRIFGGATLATACLYLFFMLAEMGII